MNDHNCNICGGDISPEHGGLVCWKCDSLSCIDERCSPAEFVNGHSIIIPYCFKCNPSSKRPAKWKEYVNKAISFLSNRSEYNGILTSLYWSLHWAKEHHCSEEYIAFLNNKIKSFRQTGKLNQNDIGLLND